jgi:hypothetical protein
MKTEKRISNKYTQHIIFAGYNDYWYYVSRHTGANLTNFDVLKKVAEKSLNMVPYVSFWEIYTI